MFFFSSRRRHTRYWRDWSSDVCSSDLVDQLVGHPAVVLVEDLVLEARPEVHGDWADLHLDPNGHGPVPQEHPHPDDRVDRKGVGVGKSVDLGGRRIFKKKYARWI